MEPTKNTSDEPGKTTGGSTGTSGTTGTGSSAGGTGSSAGRTGSPTGGASGSTGSGTTGSSTVGGSSSGTGSSTLGGGSSSGLGGGTSSSSGSGASGQTGSAPQRAREQNTGGGQSTLDQTKQTVTEAYDKTTEVLSNTYGQAMSYGRENPGKLTLIAFGAGIAIGLLLAGSGGRSSRTNRIAEPVVNALSQVAMEFFR